MLPHILGKKSEYPNSQYVMKLIWEILPTHLHQQKQYWTSAKKCHFLNSNTQSFVDTLRNIWMVLRSTTHCILAYKTIFFIYPSSFFLPGYAFMKYFKDHLQFLSYIYDSETEIWSRKFVLNITLLTKKARKKN